ncbi:MAG: aminotransferase class I/II-fold pyridoxal phosphate-dependent enzyme [Alphaproteobacteria bacterium]|nr:aminotransferase class I/II-fold pyridoxal phosphate-dependent enzyme [Alphaproteobacteria bacterium]
MEFTQSSRLAGVAPSPTVAASQKARDMKAAGRDIIALCAGEPDFDTPEAVKAAAIEAIRRGETKYTSVDGIPELKRAIANKFWRDNGIDYQLDEITVAPGGKAVIASALAASLNPGDEVVVPAPYWTSYPDMVRLFGGAPRIVETTPSSGFRLDANDLAAAISPRTKWLILNSPSNPTGAVYDRTDLQALADVLLAHPHVLALSDDIYEKIHYDGAFATLAAVEPRLKARTLTVNGSSKAFAMTGWRIGYAGGPRRLIQAMAKVASQTTSNPCSISQWAALAALEGDQSILRDRLLAYRRRRDFVVRELNAAQGVSCPTPAGAFYVFASCAGAIGKKTPDGRRLGTDMEFVDALLEAEGVALVAGAAFGASPYLRLSYVASDETLRDACARIKRFCASLA